MTKTKRARNKRLKEAEIDEFCQEVEEILARINGRCASKEKRKRKDKTDEKELAYTK
jgi:hypothetical protein